MGSNQGTNFQMVSRLNTLFGNGKGAASPGQMVRQFELIRSEFKELEAGIVRYCQGLEAINNGETTPEEVFGIGGIKEGLREVRDGIADVLVTTYGLAHRMGIDADKDMKLVQASNLSKFYVGTESNAAEVCTAMARELGIKVECRMAEQLRTTDYDGEPHAVWAFVSADDSDPERPRGKLLKAPCFVPPVFD